MHGTSSVKPVDLRAFARDYGECLIRVPGYCNDSPTCLCHDREHLNGIAVGTGFKPSESDFNGMIGCDTCHSIIDGRLRVAFFSKADIRAFKHGGLQRTWALYAQSMVLVTR